MKNSIGIKINRAPLRQILLMAGAFMTIGFFSIIFTSGIIRGHLARMAEDAVVITKEKIESDLTGSQMLLDIFAETLQEMAAENAGVSQIEKHIKSITDYILASESRIPGFRGFYFYYETDGPVFLSGIDSDVPDSYDPTERPWYRAAVEARGVTAEIAPYHDAFNGEFIYSYSRCLYDGAGNRLGVACVSMGIEGIRAYISEMADTGGNVGGDSNSGGIGMLFSQELVVLLHTDKEEYVGQPILTTDLPFSIFADKMVAGENVGEGDMVNYRGEPSVGFFQSVSNNWYIGLVLPKGPYYQSLKHMGLIIALLILLFVGVIAGMLFRLNAAKEKANAESRHKSDFLSNMSHEIRTPMTAIIGMTTLGKTARELERKDYCFTKIEEAGQHLLGVINDVLDMSKIEANKLELLAEAFDFERVLRRIVNVAAFSAEQKRQTLKVRIDRNIPKILIGDGQRLGQVIANLLGNAVKFTPEQGSVSIAASFLGEEDGICSIQVSVKDTGIGVNAEQQARIFDAFQQAEASTTRKFGGTGLGLAISKQIVEMMDGSIGVESAPGEGATFTFTVRLKRGEEGGKGLAVQGIDLEHVRIMVVDDDPDILAYFKEITQELSLSCHTAASGKEALDFISQNGPCNIYFVDWLMPDMDGLAVAKALREKSSESGNSVIIMISAAEWRTIEDKAKEAGIDKFLSKPLFPSTIMDTINEAVGADWQQPDRIVPETIGLFAGRRILLAEDIEINREIVMALLEPTLVETDCAVDGAEAVRMFGESPEKYDIIFMDLQMPVMDGYDATRRIRALDVPRAATVPIIAMTANVFREDIEKCLEAGMNGHVGKPLDISEVITVLRKYLPNGRSAAEDG
ncbi:MAG: response regulator [Oscillospiraceae bacterium]|jgi:signal transduction histidine kinase/CheY-like chemotaxis protein|nr:response regulator [Oscillospiraceae bacterium]